jgi:hypothetical protein
MAEAIEIHVNGLSEVKATLNKFAKDLETDIGFNKNLSSNLAQKASAMAPKLTGALASSVIGNGTTEKAQIVAGSAAVPYAGVIEYGWPSRNISAQPYLTPSVFNNMGYIVEEYTKNAKEKIKKYNLN